MLDKEKGREMRLCLRGWIIWTSAHCLSPLSQAWGGLAQAGCTAMSDAEHITLSRNQSGRIPFASVLILIFLRGAISAISMMKLSSWPRSNLEGLKDQGGFLLSHHVIATRSSCSSCLASSLALKVYECVLWDLSSPALWSPATVFLASCLGPDLTGIPPSPENQARMRYLEQFQAACSMHYYSDCNQSNQVSAHHLLPGSCPRAYP